MKDYFNKNLAWIYLFFSNCFVLQPAYAESSGLGRMADNVFQVEKSAQSFLHFLCVVTGACLILFSLGHFRANWKNPKQVKMSKPIGMVFLGLALIGLAFIPMGAHD